ncbi:hypothetical protein E2C01_099812 [Portunus trituberculatus]|uniref:Uncharacterized protein n=1 Tax=Portunus trituberculatus TaxID=210409 RepID=A0A5B7KGB1_PORTR|nr:hypothetical protein [Portunus trituberculatus]
MRYSTGVNPLPLPRRDRQGREANPHGARDLLRRHSNPSFVGFLFYLITPTRLLEWPCRMRMYESVTRKEQRLTRISLPSLSYLT